MLTITIFAAITSSYYIDHDRNKNTDTELNNRQNTTDILHQCCKVLSAANQVQVLQEFATLDLLSHRRAKMVVGRGSFVEAFPLFDL